MRLKLRLNCSRRKYTFPLCLSVCRYRKDLYLNTTQSYPPAAGSARPLTRLQERLLKKLGANAYPFYFEVRLRLRLPLSLSRSRSIDLLRISYSYCKLFTVLYEYINSTVLVSVSVSSRLVYRRVSFNAAVLHLGPRGSSCFCYSHLFICCEAESFRYTVYLLKRKLFVCAVRVYCTLYSTVCEIGSDRIGAS